MQLHHVYHKCVFCVFIYSSWFHLLDDQKRKKKKKTFVLLIGVNTCCLIITVICSFLFTSLITRVHDLPWQISNEFSGTFVLSSTFQQKKELVQIYLCMTAQLATICTAAPISTFFLSSGRDSDSDMRKWHPLYQSHLHSPRWLGWFQ